jgi:hypothetical protein
VDAGVVAEGACRDAARAGRVEDGLGAAVLEGASSAANPSEDRTGFVSAEDATSASWPSRVGVAQGSRTSTTIR